MEQDLYRVGAQKPLAYETIGELRDRCGRDLNALRDELIARSLAVLILSDRETMAFTGAVYVYDNTALAALLKENASLLAKSGGPDTPEAFIRKIANEWVPEKTALFDLVSDAFGDKQHPGRTDVRVPARDERYQPAYLEMLRQKERRIKAGVPAPRGPRLL